MRDKSINNHQEAETAVPASWWLCHGSSERNKVASETVPLCLVCLRWLSYERVKCTKKVKRKRKNGKTDQFWNVWSKRKREPIWRLSSGGYRPYGTKRGVFSISDISLLRTKSSGLGGDSEDCCLSVTESTRRTVPFCCVCMYGRFGNAELRGGGADGRPVFDDVYGQVAGPFFNICIQIHHSPFSRSQCIWAGSPVYVRAPEPSVRMKQIWIPLFLWLISFLEFACKIRP